VRLLGLAHHKRRASSPHQALPASRRMAQSYWPSTASARPTTTPVESGRIFVRVHCTYLIGTRSDDDNGRTDTCRVDVEPMADWGAGSRWNDTRTRDSGRIARPSLLAAVRRLA